MLRIAKGKGQKDRYVMLSPKLLAILRTWWKVDRPRHWLFPGERPETPCTTKGGNTGERRSSIDPLTATAPAAGSASPTSRSRRTWSAVARARSIPSRFANPSPCRRMLRARSLASMIRPRRSRWRTAYPWVVEQGGHGRVPRLGADQRLPDTDELTDMGQQFRDQGSQ